MPFVEEALTSKIIECVIKVHQVLGIDLGLMRPHLKNYVPRMGTKFHEGGASDCQTMKGVSRAKITHNRTSR